MQNFGEKYKSARTISLGWKEENPLQVERILGIAREEAKTLWFMKKMVDDALKIILKFSKK